MGLAASRAACGVGRAALELQPLDVVELESGKGVAQPARVVGDVVQRRQELGDLQVVVRAHLRQMGVLLVVGVLLLGGHGGVA